jgi:hypothetical protein
MIRDMSKAVDVQRAGDPSVRWVVLPLPVVGWVTVVRADNPTRAATRGRLRSLREKNRVAGGVTVARRGNQGLEGRSTYYSVLSALAVRSAQQGHDEDASGLAKASAQLEAKFSAQLKQFLSHHSLDQLPQAAFFDDLTAATARSLASWNGLSRMVLAAARVDEVEDDIAHLEGTSPRGISIAVDLPLALLERQSLGTGDLVWVFSRLIEDAAFVELLPATRLLVESSSDADVLSALLLLSTSVADAPPAPLGEDGLTDDERAVFAARFNATVGANLTAEDLADLRRDAAAGLLPRRRLRPTG